MQTNTSPSVQLAWWCAAAFAGVASAASPRLAFNAPSSYGSGGNSIATGDFNGDGKLDMAVSSLVGVDIYLGTGGGVFELKAKYTAGAQPEFVAVGDFNGDHKLDLAVVDYTEGGAGFVSILLGNGDGTFQAPVNYPVGNGPFAAVVADFNGDGKLDLAVTNYDSNSVSILLGNGNGTFQPQSTFAVGDLPWSIQAGDFNHDGKLDLVVTNYGATTISVLLGQGSGSFQPAVNYTVGGFPESVAIADFNGDGNLDLAVANSASLYISVLLGNADGTFQPAVSYPIPPNTGTPQSIAVGDFNGDGIPDLALVIESPGIVAIYLGKADGTFQLTETYPGGLAYVAVADFNGDGKPDLAVASNVAVLLGAGHGAFQHPVSYAVGAPVAVTSADFNGGGKPDLAVVATAASSSREFVVGVVSILQPQPDGGFKTTASYPVGKLSTAGTALPISSVAAGDFNNDGKIDLAVTVSGANEVSILLGNGDGTFQTPVPFATGEYPQFVAVADLNGDGNLDLVVANDTGGSVSVLLGNGDGTFQTQTSYPIGDFAESIAIGDFNNDGKLDLAVGAGCAGCPGLGVVAILLGNGDGTFQPAAILDLGYSDIPSIAAADLNGDGNLDLVLTEPPEGVVILLGKGDGSFQRPRLYLAPAQSSLVLADFNGDGNLDVAAAGNGFVSVLAGNGDGTLQRALNFLVDEFPNTLTAANLSGSSLPDLAVTNLLASTVSVLTNKTQ